YGTPSKRNVGTFKSITISVSDGQMSSALAPFDVTVVSPIDRAPTISGTPPTTATVGKTYNFTPSVSDPDNQAISFTAQNKPTWLALNAQTGALQGTPNNSNVGMYPSIVLSASDGKNTASLPAFGIQVTASAANLTISGTPSTTVTANSAYSFMPVAHDSN